MESNKFGYKLYNKSVVVYTNECGSNQNVIVICCFFPLGAMAFGRFVSRSCRFCSRHQSRTHFWKKMLKGHQAWLNAAHFGQDMARVDTSFAHLSRAFREPFAINRSKEF